MSNFKIRITRVTKNRAAMTAIYVLGAVTTLAISSLVASGIVFTFDDPTAAISTAAFVSLLSAAAISGFAVSKIADGDPKTSAIVHLIASCLLLVAGLIFGGGAGGLMNALCYLGVSSLAALLGKKRKIKLRRR